MANIKWDYADCVGYYTENPNMTVGQMVESVILPMFKRLLGEAQYKVSHPNGYPCVVLPWVDGKINDDYNIAIIVQRSESDTIPNSSLYVDIGLMDMNNLNIIRTNQPYTIVQNSGSSGGNTLVSINLTTSKLQCTLLEIEGLGYQFGYSVGSDMEPMLCSMNCIVTTLKKIEDDSDLNCLIVTGYSTDSNHQMQLLYKDTVIKQNTIRRWELPTQGNAANMYQLNDGYVYAETLFVCFPMYHTALRQLCVFDYSHGTPSSMWSRPVTIGGRKFSLHVNAGNGTSGSSSVTLAKLED